VRRSLGELDDRLALIGRRQTHAGLVLKDLIRGARAEVAVEVGGLRYTPVHMPRDSSDSKPRVHPGDIPDPEQLRVLARLTPEQKLETRYMITGS
jgi:hypothetical protein